MQKQRLCHISFFVLFELVRNWIALYSRLPDGESVNVINSCMITFMETFMIEYIFYMV